MEATKSSQAAGASGPVLPTRLAPPRRTVIRFYRPKQRTWGPFEAYGAIVIFLVLVARFVPLARWLPFWGCAMREHLGIPCLSCGMTRALDWFAQGRLIDSLLINPLGFALAASGLVGCVYLVALPLRLPRLELRLSERAGTVARYLVLVGLAANWGYLITRSLLTGAP